MKANLVPAPVLVPSFHAAGAVVWGAAAAAHSSQRARLAGKGQCPGGRHVSGLSRESRERRNACGCLSWELLLPFPWAATECHRGPRRDR